jgi:tetratricopeptide (TPR) repeat protein
VFVGAAVVIVALGVALALRRAAPPRRDPAVVAVLPFENRTGDTAYAALGQNLAERVTRGLSEIGAVELVTGAPASSERAGTRIAGSLYRRGDSVEVTATIAEFPSQVVLRTVGPLRAPAARPEPAIDELVQRLMGGVAMMFDQTYGNQGTVSGQPPTYDAYREYRTGEEHFYAFRWDSAVAHFHAAIGVDSAFMFPRVRIANAYGNATDFVHEDSALGAVEARRSRLTPFEEAYAAYLRAALQGDHGSAYAATQRMSQAAPRSAFAAYYHAAGAGFAGRWQEAVEILGRLDPESPMLRGRVYFHQYVALAWHMLGDHHRELEAAERGRRQYPDRLMTRRAELRALAALGRVDEVRARVADLWTIRLDGEGPADVVLVTAQELRAHGYPEASVEVLESLLNWLGARPEIESRGSTNRWTRAQALVLLGRLDEAQRITDSLAAEYPAMVDFLGARGAIAARRGDRAVGERVDDSLAALHGPFLLGAPTAWRAGIAAALGDRQRAVQLLSEAISQGYANLYIDDANPMFESLRDDPQFQRLRRPRP